MVTEKNAERQLIEQGLDTSRVFSGRANLEATAKLYGQSSNLFSKIISERLPVGRKYHLADFGSFKGELLNKIIQNLVNRGYNFHTYAIDRIEKVLLENSAETKIHSNLTHVPLEDKSIDIAMARYILVWNSLEDQLKILKEMTRTSKQFAIVQHAGADNVEPEEWRKKIDFLMTGKDVLELKREGCYFSSGQEIEQRMNQNRIKFVRLDELKVSPLSDMFIERYKLEPKSAKKTREILGDKDYVIRTTWLIYEEDQSHAS